MPAECDELPTTPRWIGLPDAKDEPKIAALWRYRLTATTSGLGSVSQSFTLNANVGPNLAPSITSGNTRTLVVGAAGSFTVTTNGYPLPGITESGALPIGVNFKDNGNGTAILSGTPVTGGAFEILYAGEQIVGRELNVKPTLTIRPGYPVRVLVTRDIVLGGEQ